MAKIHGRVETVVFPTQSVAELCRYEVLSEKALDLIGKRILLLEQRSKRLLSTMKSDEGLK